MQAANLIPEPYRSWLMHAAETPDPKERQQHIKEITAQVKAAYPTKFRQKGDKK